MARKRPETRRKAAAARIVQVKRRIHALPLVCSGTLLTRTKVCGKPGCRCAKDPRARHGPYYEWGRMKGGKLVHRMVSEEQAAFLRAAIDNYRTIRRLLRVWEDETVKVMEAQEEHK